jgi:hypothetical protein
MTELKVEAGKSYKCRNGRKAEVKFELDNPACEAEGFAGIVIHDDGEQALCGWSEKGMVYSYTEFKHDLISEWRDEPKAGWVYEDEFGNTIKIIANINEHIDERLSRLAINFIGINIKSGNVIKYDKDGLAQFNNHNLKLETGRPADE